MSDGFTPHLTQLAACCGSIIGVDSDGFAVRWDPTSGRIWSERWLGRVVPPAHRSGVAPIWLAEGFLAIGANLARRVGLSGEVQLEFAGETEMRGAAWNGTELLCAEYGKRTHRLDDCLRPLGSWDSSIAPSGIEFITKDAVLLHGLRDVALHRPDGVSLGAVSGLRGPLLDVQHTDRFFIASNIDDQSFVVDWRTFGPPQELRGFIAGSSSQAVWTVGWEEDRTTGGLTRWRESADGVGSPSRVSLSFEDWGSQRSPIFQVGPTTVAVAFQGGFLVLEDPPGGQVRVARTVRPARKIANALRIAEHEYAVLFEDGVLETLCLE